MLIACIGPDVFRALEKAHDLELAFRKKYDSEGTSCELLQEEGADLIEAIIERVNTVSLFTPRRFIRVRNLLSSCPKARMTSLKTALSVDPEHVIVVTVEHDALSDAALSMAEAIPKWVHYDFPRLDARDFERWINERAALLGMHITNEQVSAVAVRSNGDVWQASLALLALAAGNSVEASVTSSERSLFEWADAYVKQDPTWRTAVEQYGTDSLLYPFLSQLRSYVRVRAGQETGIPSFVARKLKGVQAADAEERLLRLLEAITLQRQGYLQESELHVLF